MKIRVNFLWLLIACVVLLPVSFLWAVDYRAWVLKDMALVLMGAWAILAMLSRSQFSRSPETLLVFTLLVILSCIPVISTSRFDFENAVTRLLPILVAMVLFSKREGLWLGRIHYLLAWGLIALLLWSLLQPTYYHESEFFAHAVDRRPRFWPFFEMSPHSSGYVVGPLVLITFFTRPLGKAGLLARMVTLAGLAAGLSLLYGYRSSQAIVTFVGFVAGAMVVMPSIPRFWKLLSIPVAAAIFGYVAYDKIFYTLELQGANFNWRLVGSGRFGTWADRVALILDRDIWQILFGTGPGSDMMYTPSWDKTTWAHNTFITYTVEYGLVGLACFIGAFWLIWRKFGAAAGGFLGAVIMSAAIGNGLTLRPTPLLLYAIAAVQLGYRMRYLALAPPAGSGQKTVSRTGHPARPAQSATSEWRYP